MRQADLFHRRDGTLPSVLAASVEQRELYVGQRRKSGQQVVCLEDKPDLPAPQFGQLVVVELPDIIAFQHVTSGGGHVETTQDVHQGGLSRA